MKFTMETINVYQINNYLWSATVTHFITFTYSITTHRITKYLTQMNIIFIEDNLIIKLGSHIKKSSYVRMYHHEPR